MEIEKIREVEGLVVRINFNGKFYPSSSVGRLEITPEGKVKINRLHGDPIVIEVASVKTIILIEKK